MLSLVSFIEVSEIASILKFLKKSPSIRPSTDISESHSFVPLISRRTVISNSPTIDTYIYIYIYSIMIYKYYNIILITYIYNLIDRFNFYQAFEII